MQTYTNNDTLYRSDNDINTYHQQLLTTETKLKSPTDDDYDDDNQSQTEMQTRILPKFDVLFEFSMGPATPAGFGAAGLSAFPDTRTKNIKILMDCYCIFEI